MLDWPPVLPVRIQNHSWWSWFWPLMDQFSTPAELVGSMVTAELPSVRTMFAALQGRVAERLQPSHGSGAHYNRLTSGKGL